MAFRDDPSGTLRSQRPRSRPQPMRWLGSPARGLPGRLALLASVLLLPVAASADGENVLPKPPPPFAGRIGTTHADSEPAFTPPVTAPAGAPNVLLVLTDDVGFGAAGTFGGPVPTPNLDRLAAEGLVYNRFHVTAMCSPTRASLLTGRNHHAVHNGIVANLTTGFPGYDNVLPRSAATIAEVLRQNGYATAMFGKHHNAPEHHVSPAGPFDLWPTSLGFEYFYGFMAAETNQFTPALYRGISPIPTLAEGVLDEALADEAIAWLHAQKGAAPRSPSSSTTRRARPMRRSTRPPTGSRASAVASTRAGTASAPTPSRVRRSRASSRAAP